MIRKDIFDLYIQNLLAAQFQVSEIIEHNLSRGEIREDFIKDRIRERYNTVRISKGFICEGMWQSPQIDLLMVRDGAPTRALGSHEIVDISDCKMVVEVKSNAQGSEINEFNEKCFDIRSHAQNQEIRTGMFCYCINLKERTLFRRFGYIWDDDIEGYVCDNSLQIDYPNIDFIFCLGCKDEESPYCIIKNIDGSYQYFVASPLIDYFFRLFAA